MLLTFFSLSAVTTLLPHQEFAKNPISWIDMMHDFGATLSGAPNFAFSLLAERLQKHPNKKYNMGNMRLLYCGAERIFPASIKSFYNSPAIVDLRPESFFPCYGMAEASLFIAGSNVPPDRLLDQSKQYSTCGQIAAGLELTVEDNGYEVGDDEIGEIHLSGPNVSPGYWVDIKNGIYLGDLIKDVQAKINTGDLVIKKNAEIFITGRAKDLICYNGRNVHPEDIEHAIEHKSQYFSTGGVIAVADDNDQSEEILILAEVRRDKRKTDFDLLLREIQRTLSSMEVSAQRLVVLSPMSMPKTSSGKKQRQLTKRKLLEGQLKVLWDSCGQDGINSVRQTDAIDLKPLADYLLLNNTASEADESRSYPADLVQFLTRNRLTGILIPTVYGGSGLSHRQFNQLAQSLGSIDLTVGAMIGNHNTIGVLPILYSDVYSNKERVLTTIAKNGEIASYALTEVSAGSNPRAIESTVVRQGSVLVLSGTKIWIGNAQFAQYITVFAKETDEVGNAVGISAFLLNRDQHDFKIGITYRTMGLRAMPQNEVIFRNLELSDKDRLSSPGQGLELGFRCMEYARFGLAALAIGGMNKALQITSEFSNSRTIWTGRLADNRFIAAELNHIRLSIRILSALVDKCAELLDEKQILPSSLSCVCKVVAGEWAWLAIDRCLQTCGGRGYIEDFGLSRILRDVRILRVFEGPTETIAYQLGSLICRSPERIDQLLSEFGCCRISNISLLEELCCVYAKQPPQLVYVIVGQAFAEILACSFYLNLLDKASEDYLATLSRVDSVLTIAKTKLRDSSLLYELEASDLHNPLVAASSQIRVQNEPIVKEFTDEVSDSAPIMEPKPQHLDNDSLSIDKIVDQIRNWLQNNTKRSFIDNLVPLVDYGLDSLLGYELLCFVEEEYGMSIDLGEIDSNVSIEILAKRIAEFNSIVAHEPS